MLFKDVDTAIHESEEVIRHLDLAISDELNRTTYIQCAREDVYRIRAFFRRLRREIFDKLSFDIEGEVER